ncbi:MAG: HAD family hydrolase [Treponema sp.]|jgi:phosphoglycolate phosphatase|nr:HAD family hydrolase [Treponema sp.]
MDVYRHFIFDMDGTLSDTARATVRATRKTAEKLGMPPPSAEKVKAVMGYPGLEYYRMLLGDIGQDLLAAFAAEADRNEDREIRRIGRDMLFPGIREALDSLLGLGVELYIASTGHPDHIALLLDVTGIRRCFKKVYCGRPRKAEMVQELMAAAGALSPEGWLMVGDMHIDAEAARSNRILAVGAGFGYCPEEKQHLFDVVVETPGELAALAGESLGTVKE